ncbi:MAG TPA: hypothetical protein V6C89_21820 [Drouetiella sp.]
MRTGALTASAVHAADIHSLAFDQVKERFLEMFPRRTESIWKRRGQRRWFTQHTTRLSDQQILDAAEGKLQRFVGARFDHRTRYAVLDIDTISPYYNVLSLVRLRRALEAAGLTITHHYQSSDSGGWHLWIFFDEAVDSTELNKLLAAWLKRQGFKLGSGVLEIFPSANGLRLPLQPGFAWLSNDTQRNQLTFEQALRRFLCDASCTNSWQGAVDHISANLVTPTSERRANKRRSGLIQERWKLGRELWRTGLQFWGQRHDAMLAVEHYLWFGDDDAAVEALPGYNNDAAREQLITDWLERKHNGMCRHINRGDWKKVNADIQRACAWRPSVHVHTPYAHTDRKIERMMENPTLTPKRFITGNIARYNYALARITSAFNELASRGRTPSINEVAEKAGAHWNTVRKHWNILTASSSDQSPGIGPDPQVVRSSTASMQSVECSSRVSLDGFNSFFALNASQPLIESSSEPSNSVNLSLNSSSVRDNPALSQLSEKLVKASSGLSSHFYFEHTKNLALEQSRSGTVSASKECWNSVAFKSFNIAGQKTLETHKLADGAFKPTEKISLPIERKENLKCFLNEPGEAFPENSEWVCKGSLADINHRYTNFYLESDIAKWDTTKLTLNVQVVSAAITTGEIKCVEMLRSAELLTYVDQSLFKSAAETTGYSFLLAICRDRIVVTGPRLLFCLLK